MKTIILISSLLLSTYAHAYGEAGRWSSGWGQGTSEYKAVVDENNSIYISSKQEQFGSDVAGGKAPRTAIGLTKDNHILLVVVDGRQSHSAGMTLLELALFMQENGAVQALNFDGGGSSEMVINNNIINKPSDGKERKVTTALAIVKK